MITDWLSLPWLAYMNRVQVQNYQELNQTPQMTSPSPQNIHSPRGDSIASHKEKFNFAGY
jgi:hypothetical protein